MHRGKRRQPVRMRPHALHIKLILHHAALVVFPIPAEEHRAIHARHVHRAEQFAHRGKRLHGPAVFPFSSAQRSPMRLTVRRRPTRGIAVQLSGIQMDMRVDDRHGAKIVRCA